jgi:SPX domain protein involved in polyphosphate accumulation
MSDQYISSTIDEIINVSNEITKAFQYLDLNLMGLRKILKKFDRHLKEYLSQYII